MPTSSGNTVKHSTTRTDHTVSLYFGTLSVARGREGPPSSSSRETPTRQDWSEIINFAKVRGSCVSSRQPPPPPSLESLLLGASFQHLTRRHQNSSCTMHIPPRHSYTTHLRLERSCTRLELPVINRFRREIRDQARKNQRAGDQDRAFYHYTTRPRAVPWSPRARVPHLCNTM